MVKRLPFLFCCFVILFLSFTKQAKSQCNNAGVESGNFTGWTGTWEDTDSQCNGGTIFGICAGTSGPDPFHYNGLNQGTNNQAADATPEKNHFIMTGGYDPLAGGTSLPVVFPGGGAYSMRLGNAQAEDGGESLSYSFLVNSTNCNFTYHYAVVLNDGGHNTGEQPFFQIRMRDANNNLIDCATYDVDATTAGSIGGFVNTGSVLYKPWTSVFIPLNNYIGQTVTIQFVTRDCFASGGSHFAYAYLDATCAPLEIISSAPTVCGGQDVILTAPAGAATYSWTGPGVTPPSNQQQATITLAGAYTVTMTTFGNVPCTFSLDTIMQGSPSNPMANFSFTPACPGDPIQFTDQSTPAGQIQQWFWDFDGDNNPDDMTQNPVHSFPLTGSYPVRLLVAWAPCLDDTIINVTVLSNPTSTFTTTSPVCAGIPSTITYTGNAPANANYTWNFDGGTIVSGTGQGPYQISWLTGGTKNITLTVAVGSCASPLTTVPVVVNPFPTIVLSPDVDICTGQSTNLTAAGATTYSWFPATDLNTTTGPNVTSTPANTITYTVTGTDNGCNGTATVTVTVNPYPNVVVNPTNTTVCAGTTTTLVAAGASSYTWTPATGLSATTGSTVDATPMVNTTYTVTGDNNGCTATATSDFIVDPAPVLNLSPDQVICEGETVTLTAGGTGNSYTWSPGTYLSATTGTSVDATPPVDITYTVTAIGNTCNTTGTIDFTVNQYPVVNVLPASAAICDGQTQTFVASGANSYVWSPATGLNSTNTASVDANPNTTQIYQVIGSNSGCNDTVDVTLTVNPIPVTVVSPDVTVCNGTSTPLQAGGANTFAWTPTTGLSSSSGANVNATPSDTTTYTVTGTSNNCSSTATVTVNVNPMPVVAITPPVSEYCDGGSVDLVASGADTYVWTPATALSATTGSDVTANPTVTTTYAVTGTTNGCDDNETITVTVHPNPVVDFAASETEGCQPLCVDFTNNTTITSGSIATYFWDTGDQGNTSPLTTFNYCYNDTGIFTVELTATSDNGCVTKLTRLDYITVHPLPVANFNFTPETASVLDPTFQFYDHSTGATMWYWYFGDGDSINNLITTPEHVYPAAEAGTYTARLFVVNQFGCTDQIVHDVVTTPVVTLYIPNAFTPNSNRVNDRFYAYGEGIVEFEMTIFNRWGEYMFRSTDINVGWDGMFNGIMVPNDVYVYVVNYVGLDDTNGVKRGSVTVVR